MSYCDTCQNTGSIDCLCGGDLCVCGREEFPCPDCEGMPGDDDDGPDEFEGEPAPKPLILD